MPDRLPSVELDHSGMTVQEPLHDRAPLDITMLIAGGPLRLRNDDWSQEPL
jgi:hypothetical protein